MSWGCQFVAVGIDISLLRQAAKENLARYREPHNVTAPSRTY
jgi:4-hydroxy-2-oxoheptanedioate aldolase